MHATLAFSHVGPGALGVERVPEKPANVIFDHRRHAIVDRDVHDPRQGVRLSYISALALRCRRTDHRSARAVLGVNFKSLAILQALMRPTTKPIGDTALPSFNLVASMVGQASLLKAHMQRVSVDAFACVFCLDSGG